MLTADIRPFRQDDDEMALVDLWRRCGLARP
jgi:hypothetical protein